MAETASQSTLNYLKYYLTPEHWGLLNPSEQQIMLDKAAKYNYPVPNLTQPTVAPIERTATGEAIPVAGRGYSVDEPGYWEQQATSGDYNPFAIPGATSGMADPTRTAEPTNYTSPSGAQISGYDFESMYPNVQWAGTGTATGGTSGAGEPWDPNAWLAANQPGWLAANPGWASANPQFTSQTSAITAGGIQDSPPEGTPGAAPQGNYRLALVGLDPANPLRVATGSWDGSDPQWFDSMAEAEAYAAQQGQTIHQVQSADEARDIVRRYTGQTGYMGYTENYQPPVTATGYTRPSDQQVLFGTPAGGTPSPTPGNVDVPPAAPPPSGTATPPPSAAPGADIFNPASNTGAFAGYQWNTNGLLTLRPPGATDNSQDFAVPVGEYTRISGLVDQGYTAINTQGNPFHLQRYQGGLMFGDPDAGVWFPLNVLLGGAWLPEQQAAMPDFMRQLPPTEIGGKDYWLTGAGTGVPLIPETDLETIERERGQREMEQYASALGKTFDQFTDEDWQEARRRFGSQIDLNVDFSAHTNTRYGQVSNATQQMMSGGYIDPDTGQFVPGFYDANRFPTMEAAQLDTAGIPQPTAQTPGSNQALDFLLSGQGFSPEMLGRLRTEATDALTNQARMERSSARLQAEQAGLAGAPGAQAVEAQAVRRAGDARTRALNQIEIENAMRGLENTRLAAPMELSRSTNAAQMTNQMALQNAANVFSGMQQNVANLQQRNISNLGTAQEREMARAGQQAGYQTQASQQYQQALMNRAMQGEFTNLQNTINQNLNQANLDRQRAMYNTGTRENRYSQGLASYLSLLGNTNPFTYNVGGANIAGIQSPNLIPASFFQNVGQAGINTGAR